MRLVSLVAAVIAPSLVACAAEPDVVEDDADWLDGKADGQSSAGIRATALDVSHTGKRAIATIELERDGNVALEAGGLEILAVSDERGARQHRIVDGELRVSSVRGPLVIEYTFSEHDDFDGLLAGGSTLVWPEHCGNLFPCHSRSADSTTFELAVSDLPAGTTAVHPRAIGDAPSYVVAWAVGEYTRLELGTTPAGTRVVAFTLPGGDRAARGGTTHFVAAIDWLERTLGPYAFGDELGSVAVDWGGDFAGGMEHVPYAHLTEAAMAEDYAHVHEAVHGWYGNAVRLRCWEDLVLSEGTTSYLTARVLGKVAGAAREAELWATYQTDLDDAIATAHAGHHPPAWPEGCNVHRVREDNLHTNLPYKQGAFFYKEVAEQVGADVLDGVLARFYQRFKHQPAGMQDMIDAIEAETGFDPAPLVAARLRRQF